MKLPPFEYLEPASVPEALAMLDAYRDKAQIIAGGTEVINRLKLRLISPDCIMNIKKLRELDGIVEQEQSIVIGANVSLKELQDFPLLRDKYKAIAEASLQVAAPPLARMGTIGGNILQNTRCLFYNQSAIVLKGLEVCHKRGGATCVLQFTLDLFLYVGLDDIHRLHIIEPLNADPAFKTGGHLLGIVLEPP